MENTELMKLRVKMALEINQIIADGHRKLEEMRRQAVEGLLTRDVRILDETDGEDY